MNRLTERDEHGNAAVIDVDSADLMFGLSGYQSRNVTDALDRLAAYEDTGLTPEEIAELQVTHRTERCEAADYDCAELGRYRRAEADGQLIVLPCKVGDTVYVLGCPCEPIEEWKILHPGISYEHLGVINHIPLGILRDSIGKTVFLTREEAEAALAKEAGIDG